jgi:hypothetical protein
MALIIDDIYSWLETNIAGIRAGAMASNGSAGAHFNWNPCNAANAAEYKVGPNADIFLRQETQLDEAVNDAGSLYGSWIFFDIEVTYVCRDPMKNPMREGQILLWKCHDDLKRLFGREHSLGDSGAFDIVRAGPARAEYTQLADRPGKIISPWKVNYWQHRENPDLPGG